MRDFRAGNGRAGSVAAAVNRGGKTRRAGIQQTVALPPTFPLLAAAEQLPAGAAIVFADDEATSALHIGVAPA